MAIPTALAGLSVEPMTHHVDARWVMAYAAGLGDHRADYLDTLRPGGIVAHPLFVVCPEWPVIVSSRAASEELGVTRDEVLTGVHAEHDTTIHRLVRPGDTLTTSLQIVGLVNRPPGALSVTRLQTVDGAGAPVASTTQGGIYLGVPAAGDDRPDPEPPPPIEGVERRGEPDTLTVPVGAGAAHVYTECARIWNPIHTDRVVARAAGLPDIILHGTANLAHGVTAVIDTRADGRPELIRRIRCRFAAMVPLPSSLHIRVWPANDTGDGRSTVPFEVLNDDGAAAVRDGLVVLGEPG